MAEIQHIHLVSDATGETINSVARACLAQFESVRPREHVWSLIRSPRQLDMVLEGLRQWPGLVLYTFVDKELRRMLEEFCARKNLPHHSLLDPVLTAMSAYFGVDQTSHPGRQHVLDAEYFARIDAMDFALAQDDGHKAEHISEADVVILGVSRTSKTPVSLYLANRGIKAANIPLIPGIAPPAELMKIKDHVRPLLIGLMKEPNSLIEVRRSRLRFLQSDENSSYTDPEAVRLELREARRLFSLLNCAVIDVTRRSIEETSAEIIMLMNRRALTEAVENARNAEKNG